RLATRKPSPKYMIASIMSGHLHAGENRAGPPAEIGSRRKAYIELRRDWHSGCSFACPATWRNLRDTPQPTALRGITMQLPRRRFLHLTAAAAACPAVPRVAWAEAYPSRPVHLVVPVAPGGALDIIARLLGQWLSERVGQPFVIENRPGAGTNIGVEAVVRSAPDGYTLLLVPQSVTTNATLYDKLSFNFIRDIVPIAMISSLPLVMEVNVAVPAHTVPEFIAYAKANPGKIAMASGGSGSASHVGGELFKMMTPLHLIHLPHPP